jgi:hypothetical protein
MSATQQTITIPDIEWGEVELFGPKKAQQMLQRLTIGGIEYKIVETHYGGLQLTNSADNNAGIFVNSWQGMAQCLDWILQHANEHRG